MGGRIMVVELGDGEEGLGLGPGSKVGAGSTSEGGSALGTNGISGAATGPFAVPEGVCWSAGVVGWGFGFEAHSVIVWGGSC